MMYFSSILATLIGFSYDIIYTSDKNARLYSMHVCRADENLAQLIIKHKIMNK